MPLPSLVVTARLSLGTQFEPKNTLWDKTGALGQHSMPSHPSGHTQRRSRKCPPLQAKGTLSPFFNLRTQGKT